MSRLGLGLLTAVVFVGGPAQPEPEVMTSRQLRTAMDRFAPVELRMDLTRLPETERAALGKLVEACRVMDALYLRQEWGGNGAVLQRLLAEPSSTLKADRLEWFRWNKGPWSVNDGAAPFVEGVAAKPQAGTFYPPDATKAEVMTWLETLRGDERKAAESSYTVIRRKPDGRLSAVPYSVEYQPELARAAALLRDAAKATAQPTLRSLLEKRAQAFLSNAYTESDAALVLLDSSIDVAVGPYEPDEDGWLGAKTAFECLLALRDDESTKQVATLAAQLPILHQRLPVAPALRGPAPAQLGPILVLDLLYATGEADQARAPGGYGLPNDPEATRAGTRTAVYRNVLGASFPATEQIALRTLEPKRARLTLEDVVLDVAMVRMMDGMGPRMLSDGSRSVTTAMQELAARAAQLRSMLMELWAVGDLVERGIFSQEKGSALYSTFLVLTLGRAEARNFNATSTAASVLILTRLLKDGAIWISSEGRLDFGSERIAVSVRKQLAELLNAQVSGNVASVRSMFSELSTIDTDLERILRRLKGLPPPRRPIYVTAEKLTP